MLQYTDDLTSTVGFVCMSWHGSQSPCKEGLRNGPVETSRFDEKVHSGYQTRAKPKLEFLHLDSFPTIHVECVCFECYVKVL